MNRMIVLSTAGIPHLVLTALLAMVISGVVALWGRLSAESNIFHRDESLK